MVKLRKVGEEDGWEGNITIITPLTMISIIITFMPIMIIMATIITMIRFQQRVSHRARRMEKVEEEDFGR